MRTLCIRSRAQSSRGKYNVWPSAALPDVVSPIWASVMIDVASRVAARKRNGCN